MKIDWYSLIIIFILVSGASFTYKKYAKGPEKNNALESIRAMLLNLILEAEKTWGGGTGLAKKSFVLGKVLNSQFYIGLPAFIKLCINAETIAQLIDEMVIEQLKPFLQSNIDLQRKVMKQ